VRPYTLQGLVLPGTLNILFSLVRCLHEIYKRKGIFFLPALIIFISDTAGHIENKFSVGLGTEFRRTNNVYAIRSTNILTLHGTEPILLAFLKATDLTRNSTSHRM